MIKCENSLCFSKEIRIKGLKKYVNTNYISANNANFKMTEQSHFREDWIREKRKIETENGYYYCEVVLTLVV